MATAKISQATWDAIGNELIRNDEGITNLTHNVLHMGVDHPRASLREMCGYYVAEGNGPAVWSSECAILLDKHHIPYRDAEKKYETVYGQALNHLMIRYMKTHKLEIARVKTKFGTWDVKFVKKE